MTDLITRDPNDTGEIPGGEGGTRNVGDTLRIFDSMMDLGIRIPPGDVVDLDLDDPVQTADVTLIQSLGGQPGPPPALAPRPRWGGPEGIYPPVRPRTSNESEPVTRKRQPHDPGRRRAAYPRGAYLLTVVGLVLLGAMVGGFALLGYLLAVQP